jgi:BlaI family transcriptional regulator, penicillinase repressor
VGAPKLSKLEFQIMEVLWGKGETPHLAAQDLTAGEHARKLSIREILEALPARRRPAYTTIQTTVYRMEAKGVVRRVRKVGNFHLFSAAITRDAAQRRMIDELLALFGGRPQPVMVHLVETGKLSMEDVKEAEETLRKLSGKVKRS